MYGIHFPKYLGQFMLFLTVNKIKVSFLSLCHQLQLVSNLYLLIPQAKKKNLALICIFGLPVSCLNILLP